MNDRYYAVIRSTDNHLAHYGVKGMKWGVRKAIERGNDKALGRQYKKAMKKLDKLNKKADVGIQTKKMERANKIAKHAGRIGIAGSAAAATGTAAQHVLNKINPIYKRAYKAEQKLLDQEGIKSRDIWFDSMNDSNADYLAGKKTGMQNRLQKEVYAHYWNEANDKYAAKRNAFDNAYSEGVKQRQKMSDVSKNVQKIGAGVGALGLGTAAIAKASALRAKSHISDKGHAKAVAERDAWKKEMNKAFKGTKYDTSRRRKSK